jgi:hypothetical protein
LTWVSHKEIEKCSASLGNTTNSPATSLTAVVVKTPTARVSAVTVPALQVADRSHGQKHQESHDDAEWELVLHELGFRKSCDFVLREQTRIHVFQGAE